MSDKTDYLKCWTRVFVEIETGKTVSARSLSDAIWPAFRPVDNPRLAGKLIDELLPRGTWRWLTFDKRISELRDAELSPEQIDHIGKRLQTGEALGHRVSMLFYVRSRYRRLKEAAERDPERWGAWRLSALGQPTTPTECLARAKAHERFDSASWNESPPCWRPDCGCSMSRYRRKG